MRECLATMLKTLDSIPSTIPPKSECYKAGAVSLNYYATWGRFLPQWVSSRVVVTSPLRHEVGGTEKG